MQLRDGMVCFVGIDPGGHTGYATYTAELLTNPDACVREWSDPKWNTGQLGPEPHHKALWDLLGDLHVYTFVIIMESFQYRWEQRTNLDLSALEYIGVTKLFVEERNATLPPHARVSYFEQTAATGKGFWYPKKRGTQQRDGSKLKAVDLYTPTTHGYHQNDAMAHLLHWMSHGPLERTDLFLPLKDI
jgi:hypothetical protein